MNSVPSVNYGVMLTEREFEHVYDEYADRIFRHCFFRVFRRERAQEIMQDTFLRTWQVNVRGEEIRNIRALLYKIKQVGLEPEPISLQPKL